MLTNEIAPYKALLKRDADPLPFAVRTLDTKDPSLAEAIAIAWAFKEMQDVEQPQPTSLVLEKGEEKREVARWGDAGIS